MALPSSRSEPGKSPKFWWIKTRRLFRSQLNRFPALQAPVIGLWRTVKLQTLKWKRRVMVWTGAFTGTYCREIDVDRVYWVSPQRIVYSALKEFGIHDFRGRIIGGDWDRLEKKFEDLDVYVAFKHVCIEGGNWAETVFYQRVLDELEKGRILWECRNKDDLDQRCFYLESLFHQIGIQGYKSQRELLSARKVDDPLQAEEVTINVGRHGDLLFSDGAHRLAIAKLLGISEIPVEIAVRHSEWVRFRKELLSYGQEGRGNYPPITHPDLQDTSPLPCCEERFMAIKDNMSARQGCLGDFGAGLGYFCHRFEDEGFDCYAVESDQTRTHLMNTLKYVENKRFEVIAEPVLDCRSIQTIEFDVVLALGTFHRFLRVKEDYDKFVSLLRRLQVKELFFEPQLACEPHIQPAYKDYSPTEFIEFLLLHSCLKQAELVAEFRNGGVLYKLH